MTSNGRGSNSDRSKRRETHEPESDVFRTSSEEQRWAQRRWPEAWTVAEQFIREGFYYRLLRRPVGAKTVSTQLTKRENDVLRLACAGHSNKGIAHALNVSASTVGVLLFRAAGKLNASSRNDLLSAYKRLVASSPPDEASSGTPRRLKR